MAAAASPAFMITVRREIGSESVGRSYRFMFAPYGWGTPGDHVTRKYITAVIQRAVSPLSTSPPASGSAHPGESSRVKINILKTKAP